MMYRLLSAGMLFALFVVTSLSSATPTAAAEQGFFEGSWHCQHGMDATISEAFGPWYVWRSTSKENESRAFMRKTNAGAWIKVGADTSGGWYSMTAPGWQGNTLTFTGTYGNTGTSQSMKQVYTRNSQTAMTIQTWQNGSLTNQTGCNR